MPVRTFGPLSMTNGSKSGASYWLTRLLILRLVGLIYLVASVSLAQQVLPLIGEDGLLPAHSFLESLAAQLGARGDAALRLPSLFWLGASDTCLVAGAWLGAALSSSFCSASPMHCC